MKENMLLQYSDDMMKVELQTLRNEMLQFVARYGTACAGAVESAGRRATTQLEQRLQLALEQMRDAAGHERAQHEASLQQLLTASRSQTGRLAKLESACLTGKAAGGSGAAGSAGGGGGSNDGKGFLSRHLMQATAASASSEVVAGRLEQTLEKLTEEVQGLREQMERQLQITTQNSLPAGTYTLTLYSNI